MSFVPLRRNRDFLLLQSGQLLSTFGSSMSTIAYPLLALAVTHSASDAGYVGSVVFVPMLLFNLVAGVAADRFERRRVMILSDVAGAAALAAIAAAVLTDHASLWLILAVAFVDSTAGVFFRAGQSGAFRAVVPQPQLAAAASTAQARASFVRLGGPPAGGVLFGLARSLPFLADACSYAFSTASLLLMRTRFQEERPVDREPVRRQFREGIAYFAGMPFLRTTLMMVAASNFTFAGLELALIVLGKRHGLSSAAVGVLVALTGAGALVGALASPLLRRALALRTILLLEFWAAVVYVVFLLDPNVYVLAAAVAVQAFCFPNTDAAVAAYSYALIPDRLLGRAMSASTTLRVLVVPLGPLVAGLLLGSVSPRLTVGLLMAVTIVTAALGTMSRAIREAPMPEASPAEAG